MKKAGWIIVIIVSVGLGFFIRGLIPGGGGMPPGMMGMGQMPPPAVKVMELQEAPLDAQDEYIAAIEPVQEVMIRSEVSGYIDAVHFKEGSLVKQGDLLFTINQQQYQAIVEVREAELARAKAEVTRSERFLKRMHEASERSVSQADLDAAESDHLQAVANLKQAEANLTLARIDLAYSEIRAPIDGRIGAALLTKGNYVDSMSGTTLAHIVQTDPIRVVFSMTDRAYLNLRSKEIAGAVEGLVGSVRLPNGVMLPQVGKKEFDDNVLNGNTDTLAVRYRFDNPDGLLMPGGYATILLGLSERSMGIRIPQKAVLADQQGSYVLTVNDEGVAAMTRIETGDTVKADIVVTSGLKPGDLVVIEGVQKASPGAPVQVIMQGNEQ